MERQRQLRRTKFVPTDAVVADLSAGFWVSLLTRSYESHFKWRYNLVRIFPNDPTAKREDVSPVCDKLLDLRNRIAHHEPVHHLPLEERRSDLDRQIAAMCSATAAFARHACTFATHWRLRPNSDPAAMATEAFDVPDWN